MDYKANEVKVGLMLIVGFGLLILFLVAIFGVNWGENTKEYKTYFKNIPGIVKGSLVKYGGMDVGVVTGIELPEQSDMEAKIELWLKVDEKTPVRMNSQAFVTSVGIMADQHIEISPGTPDAALLPPGSVLKSKEVLSFMQMAEPLGDLSGEMQVLVERISDLFDDTNRAHLASMIENMDKILVDGGDQFIRLTKNLDELTGNLAEVSTSLNELMTDNKGNFDETVAHLEATTKETSALITDVRKTLAKFENMVTANGTSIVEIMENFQFASQNFEEFTRIVKERPWLLVRKAAPPERKLP